MSISNKISDKIASKISGRQVKTMEIGLDEFLEIFDRIFLANVSSDSEFDAIYKVAKGSFWKVNRMDSKDGRYSLSCNTASRGSIISLNTRDWIHILDNETGIIYEYHAAFWGKFKKSLQGKIALRRGGWIPPVDEEDEAVIICPSCGAELHMGAKFCNNCGEEIESKNPESIVCPNCNTQLPAGTKFCSNCGEKIKENS